jgi:hypothetical protein
LWRHGGDGKLGQIEAALASGRFEGARLYLDALTATEAVSAGLPNLGRLMCDGGLSRLTERYIAAKIVAAALTMLATLTNRTCMAAGESSFLTPSPTTESSTSWRRIAVRPSLRAWARCGNDRTHWTGPGSFVRPAG